MPLEKHYSLKAGFIGLLLLLICATVPRISAEKAPEKRPAEGTSATASVNVRPLVDSIYAIPELYEGITLLDGQTVKVFGSFVSAEDSKLVTNYSQYAADELMPLNSIIYITGVLPDSAYWHGGVMIVTGVVSKSVNTLPVYPQDTIDITMSVISISGYEYIMKVEADTIPTLNMLPSETEDFEPRDIAACDPCKFAILISGGGSGKNNKPSYWKNIEELYNYKTSATGGNYCPENVKILYFEGNSGNPGSIPNSAVDSCTKANIQKAHDDIAKKIADCERAGKPATVQKMVTNHGSKTGGIVLLGTERLPGNELKDMQQKLIDSCCDFMFDEFIQCYGGQIVDSLKKLDDKNKTEIHANSAAGPDTPGWSPWRGMHEYLKEKIKDLTAGDDYEDAVGKAKVRYKDWLDSLITKKGRDLDSIQKVLDTLNAGSPRKRHLDSLKSAWRTDSTKMAGSSADGSRSFVRYIFKEYCEWKKIVVTPGGQAIIDFKGTGGCGNVTVYCEDATGKKVKVKVWNWNLPGSAGYQSGNNRRVINRSLTGCSTGVFWLHNDNGAFTATVESSPKQALTESASNQSTFAGFSVGGRDSSASEFRLISAPTHFTPGISEVGFDLQTAPAMLGPCDGVMIYGCDFGAPVHNQWWDDMELWIRVRQVLQPGILQVQCNSAEIPVHSAPVDNDDSEIVFALGTVQAPGIGQIFFNASSGVCFTIDCWGLRSRVPTFPTYICGDANGDFAVNISDAVYLIAYIFAGGATPNPLAAADANCDGAVNISDAVYLIAYIFAGGPPPCAACK